MKKEKESSTFFGKVLTLIIKGPKIYYWWVGYLLFFVVLGGICYLLQLNKGMIVTAMRDQVSWGFYIANFTFLVGVAAAAVYLVIPGYIYKFEDIKEIAVIGELLAIVAIIMAILFVIVDVGRPDRVWHLIPRIGRMNFPVSLLAWDIIALNSYLVINVVIAWYIIYNHYYHREPNKAVYWPLILASIPLAVSIHTVTAFLYNGLAARPFWNSAIIAPRFIASAFCSGPALMLIVFQIARKVTNIRITNRAIFKIAELIAYAMAINLFLLVCEYFKEYYSDTSHIASFKYLYMGLHGKNALVPFIWIAILFNVMGFLLLLFPKTRENLITLNIGCVLILHGVYIEKGMGLVIPGFIPDVLGEIYEYTPTFTEFLIGMGIWGFGMLLYTIILKVAIPIKTGDFTSAEVEDEEALEFPA
jgi:Ni/Fe-hydrogenase subunit HybB-like protein